MTRLDDIYSELILDLYRHPVNEGRLKNPSLVVEGGNPSCGDEVVLYLRLKDGVIQDARHEGHGCAISKAAASLLTEKVKGMTVQDVLALTPQDVFQDLGNIIQTRVKCALLPQHVLQQGLQRLQKDPAAKRVRGVRI